jgi:cholesterol oxidase
MANYDAVIIGSGFGGAVAACRLAENGAKVLVLERGRRWTPQNFPRAATDPWLFSHRWPHFLNGWFDVRVHPQMIVLLGAGVGGGSLSYAGVLVAADAERFASGWPAEITFATLAPHFDAARRMLGAATIPAGQETPRSQIMRRAAQTLGYADRLVKVPLGITFDDQYSYALRNPIDAGHSKFFVNASGIRQGTCVHLGNCQVGCEVLAKNTLDLNYLAVAEKRGTDVRPLHVARCIEPQGSGYRVHYRRLHGERYVSESVAAERVILAAGSLGSTEMLLRCRDEFATLPKISTALGTSWSANANVMTSAPYPQNVEVHQGIGPMITSTLNFMDDKVRPHRFVIEDDGLPNFVLNILAGRNYHSWLARLFAKRLHRGYGELNPMRQQMMWLGAGVDAGDGRLGLKRGFLSPWRKQLNLAWPAAASRSETQSIFAMQTLLSQVEGGRAEMSAPLKYLGMSNTVHPLGGCPMNADPARGVVDQRGQVHGYPNLFVLDGAIVPTPLGRNPALTIAALAERGVGLMAQGN